MFTELLQAAPLALLFSLPVALLGGLLLVRLRHRSLTATMVALVLVPLVAALAGVLGVSGFMYTPQLVGTVVVCLVVGAVTVPAGLLLGRRVAHEAMWQREALEAERRAEDARRRLVAGMSHDLRSPLAGICGMADALVDGVVRDPDEVRDYLCRIRREASRMTAMVGDLFQLARATSGTLQLTLEPLALAEAASDAVAAEAVAAREARVEITAVAPDGWPTVLGSDTDLTRVLRNVLSNAVRHTGSGETVQLSAGVRGATAWLRVDDGCGGIPDEDLPLIFDIGYRGSGARTPSEHSGAGLGLSIARGLMEAQGGGITVVNHGSGCRAEITLAVAARPARVGAES
jgi:signal transduction histidine kinase